MWSVPLKCLETGLERISWNVINDVSARGHLTWNRCLQYKPYLCRDDDYDDDDNDNDGDNRFIILLIVVNNI